MEVTRAQVLAHRVRVQQLNRESGEPASTAVLDIGVQDTGPDGGLWALAIRGVDVAVLSEDELVTVWTIRGAPHLYRRADLPAVSAAVEPFSDADAGKRIFDAAKPLKAAGIGNLAAFDTVAAAMQAMVTAPMVKGEVSAQLATPKHVADYLDAPMKDVRARWPADAVEVFLEGERRWMLRGPLVDDVSATTRLLGPFDLFLQARDRSLLVGHPAHAKALWPVLGRPGAVLHGAEIVGTWRPRSSGRTTAVQVEPFTTLPAPVRAAIEAQAERLAAYRGRRLSAVDIAG